MSSSTRRHDMRPPLVVKARAGFPLVVVLGVLACGSASAPTVPDAIQPFDAVSQPQLAGELVTTNGAHFITGMQAKVVVRNADTKPHTMTVFLPCTVVFRLYADPSRSGPVAYAQGSGAGGCKASARVDTVGAGAVRTYMGSSQLVVNIFDPAAYPPPYSPPPAGLYYVTASMPIRELPGGSVELYVGTAFLVP